MRRFQISDMKFGIIAMGVGSLELIFVYGMVVLMRWGVPPWIAGAMHTLGHLVLGMCISAWMSSDEPLMWLPEFHGDLLLRRDVHLSRKGDVMLMTQDRKKDA